MVAPDRLHPHRTAFLQPEGLLCEVFVRAGCSSPREANLDRVTPLVVGVSGIQWWRLVQEALVVDAEAFPEVPVLQSGSKQAQCAPRRRWWQRRRRRRKGGGVGVEGGRQGVRGEGVAAAHFNPALRPTSLPVPPPVAGRAGDVIHLLVGRVTEGDGGGRPWSPEAGRPQGGTGRGRWREKQRRGGRRRRKRRRGRQQRRKRRRTIAREGGGGGGRSRQGWWQGGGWMRR